LRVNKTRQEKLRTADLKSLTGQHRNRLAQGRAAAPLAASTREDAIDGDGK
jgi:hypothetical protein